MLALRLVRPAECANARRGENGRDSLASFMQNNAAVAAHWLHSMGFRGTRLFPCHAALISLMSCQFFSAPSPSLVMILTRIALHLRLRGLLCLLVCYRGTFRNDMKPL